MFKMKSVIVGISGGVDSAVAALLLKQKGYYVQGVFMQNWDIADEKGHCSADADYTDASVVCDILKIKLHHKNFVKEYWNEVFSNLIKEYQLGYTPNPDILCNRIIKFKYFYNYATRNLQADAIATGHYAKTSFGPYLENFQPKTGVRLLLAKDVKKDQTFFLSQIEQEALRHTMFPLADLTKQQVKQIASNNGLDKFATKRESMGICFIGSRNFQNFIREYIDNNPGDFVDIDTGKVVGQHDGIHQWTLGQRTRLQGLSEAYFVARKDVECNIIYVAKGTHHPLLYSSLTFTNKPHWIYSKPEALQNGDILECKFKFQHTETWVNCKVCETYGGLIVQLEKPKRALTPGQYAVFALDNECLGSARIANEGITNYSLHYKQNIESKVDNEIIYEEQPMYQSEKFDR